MRASEPYRQTDGRASVRFEKSVVIVIPPYRLYARLLFAFYFSRCKVQSSPSPRVAVFLVAPRVSVVVCCWLYGSLILAITFIHLTFCNLTWESLWIRADWRKNITVNALWWLAATRVMCNSWLVTFVLIQFVHIHEIGCIAGYQGSSHKTIIHNL